MPGRVIRLGTFAGIPFGVHPLWLVIVLLITFSLAVGYYPAEVGGIAPAAAWGLGLVSALLLFASIVAHEYGHAIVARRRGVEVEEIDLWLLGGVARLRGSARRPQDELAYALAGPAVTLAVTLAFSAALALIPQDQAPALRALVAYQALVNGAVLVFNLLPAFPLDGGRVLRALLWRSGGDIVRATVTAATVGRGFGFALIALGLLSAASGAIGGLWLALIGMFLITAAAAEAMQAEAQEVFRGVGVRELMTAAPRCLDERESVADAVGEILAGPHPVFPVVAADGRAVGVLAVSSIEALAPARRAAVAVGELTDRDPGLLVDPRLAVTELLEAPAFARVGRAVVVAADGRPLGIVSITDAQRALELRRRLGQTAAGA